MSAQSRAMKVIWVMGSFSKLVHLGMVQDAPMNLTDEGWDFYNQIDQNRDLISDSEIRAIVEAGVRSGDFIAPDKNGIIHLLCDYKNKREEMVRYCLESMIKK